ncbi:HAD family hydrolase [Candidatus Woesearchaeota archaeon]|jgi:HAD superfamily phosphatase (TIGR01681 family)|nr:HAD family hydrolase [Candidatus Woesearchaeota archaeon]MBT3729869.1 HAD family hydrolase [bacterium]MBT5759140.1 HAD family hydrolase [Candidatus Neomarinimicrobiota bacterium]MBT4208613.1 HAD family hydrolase [Candidatus Woesearchaeota archaeon]MBT4730818.1 HAD family hydrolase [Candidatus Woesearchaeota archaeon]
MKKKIIFFDGDGTLWYPKSTKYKEKPHWVYLKSKNTNEHYRHLVMIPTVLSTLRKLKKMGIITVLLSTHPHPPKEADSIINHKVSHFKLNSFFDEIHATREYHQSKGEFIIKILKKYNIPKSKALMIGDNYHWDYKPAVDVGVDALLIESEYMKKDGKGRRIKRVIKRLSNIFKYIS